MAYQYPMKFNFYFYFTQHLQKKKILLPQVEFLVIMQPLL